MELSESHDSAGSTSGSLAHILAVAFFVVSLFFAYKSFYGMRIKGEAA